MHGFLCTKYGSICIKNNMCIAIYKIYRFTQNIRVIKIENVLLSIVNLKIPTGVQIYLQVRVT